MKVLQELVSEEIETIILLFKLLVFVAIYKPDPAVEYTEDTPVEPYDYMSKLVKDWEFAAKIHPDVEKRCRQVFLRSGQSLWCYKINSIDSHL